MSIYKTVATCGFIGYLPFPGTMATLATLPLVYLLDMYSSSWFVYNFILFVFSFVAYYAVHRSQHEFEIHDSPTIVIDEVIGTLVTFYYVPFSLYAVISGFVLFRFFDIIKLGPVGWADRRLDIHGVMLDDIIAGLCANVIMRVCLYYI